MSGGGYREVSSRSWGDRLMESIKGVAIGFLLFVVSFPLLFWNEGRAVDTARALEQGKGDVVEANAQAVDPANEGKEVHVTGDAVTRDVLTDPDFHVSANALRLRRKAEMYQWKEDVKTEKRQKIGGGEEEVKTYTYSKAWSEQPLDSGTFHDPKHPDNPPMPYQTQVWNANQVKLGAFDLPVNLLGELGPDKEERLPAGSDSQATPTTRSETRATRSAPTRGTSAGGETSPSRATRPAATRRTTEGGEEEEPPARGDTRATRPAANREAMEDDEDRETAAAETKVQPDGTLYLGKTSSAPAIGDERIEFKVLPQPRTVSVVARQLGGTFQPYEIKGRKFTLYRLMDGSKTAPEMFQQMEQENKMLTWILRLVGFVLMAVGIFLVLRPLATLGAVLPFLGDLMSGGIALFAGLVALALSLVTISIGWLFYRPLLGGGLLAAAVALIGGLYFLVIRARRRRLAYGDRAGAG